jgi:hypothetical protein
VTHTLSFDHTPKELVSRRSGTCEVALFWSRRTHRAAVKLEDSGTGTTFELPLGENDDPLDVFNHPFAYAAARGVSSAPAEVLPATFA